MERLGLQLARLYLRLAGFVAVTLAGVLFLGAALLALGILVLIGEAAVERRPLVITMLTAVAIGLTIIGLPLLFGRGKTLFRTILPAMSGALFALVLVKTPELGLIAGGNTGTFAISAVLGLTYLCLLVIDGEAGPYMRSR